MNNQPYKELFNKLKLIGLFGDFETYEAYMASKKDNPDIKPPSNLEGWKKTLTPEDQIRFNQMFN